MSLTKNEQKLLSEIATISEKLLKKHMVDRINLTEKGKFLMEQIDINVMVGKLAQANIMDLI